MRKVVVEVFRGSTYRTGKGGSARFSHYARWDKHIMRGTTKKPEKKESENQC